MYILREELYLGTALLGAAAACGLKFGKPRVLKLFSFYLLCFLALDFFIAYFVVDTETVSSESFRAWMSQMFGALWITLRIPAGLFVGMDEVVEEHGIWIATFAYFGSLVGCAYAGTILHFVGERLCSSRFHGGTTLEQ